MKNIRNGLTERVNSKEIKLIIDRLRNIKILIKDYIGLNRGK